MVLVVKDGAAWLRRCLASLGRQSHPRLGVLAVDNASSDDSPQILTAALGADRVVRLERNYGFPGAVRRALSTPAAGLADFVLLIHDDTALAPEAVARLVEAAGRLEDVGVVGPKVLDWDRPGVLLEIGLATDRFGYPYSPLEEDEIDQGQYDAPREVLFVSSTAMLVSREAWSRADLLDERVGTGHADLDFCWRVRLAGFRVLVDPRAVVLHRAAGDRGERPGWAPRRGRYLAERAALMSLLKNYRLLSLAWVLPLYAAQGVLKVLLFAVSGRLSAAVEVVEAWGWNLFHLPGTIRRRVRGHAVRRARDRDVARFMAPAAARLRRWVLQLSSVLVRSGEEAEEPALVPRRVAGLLRARPVAFAWAAAVILSIVAFRGVLFSGSLEGGALPSFPERFTAFFREFGAGWTTTGFGGPSGASPALVPLGAASLLAFGNPQLVARLLIALAPILAGVSCYRALIRWVGEPLVAVTAAAAYALSALSLWAVSEGRIGVLVFLIAVPWIGSRIAEAFDDGPVDRPLRWATVTGMGLAVAISFFPAAWIGAAALALGWVLLPRAAATLPRGALALLGAGGAAALLVFPFALTLAGAAGGASVDAAGRPEFAMLLRLAPGPAPGSWAPALFLPLAGALGLGVAGDADRDRAWRSAITAGGGILLALLAAQGRLPAALANPITYLAVAGFALSTLIALGLKAAAPGAVRHAFGVRAVALGGLLLVVGAGVVLQSVRAAAGGWGVGEDRVPPGWPVVSSAEPGTPFRVVWMGRPGGDAFLPPGGAPDGIVAAGPASVRYGVTGKAGRSVLAAGSPATGIAHDRLRDVLASVLTGRVRHGGALLASMGVRYVVAQEGDLPGPAARRLGGQVDLDLIQRAGGLSILRVAPEVPEGWALAGAEVQTAARSGRLTAPARVFAGGMTALERTGGSEWRGTAGLTEDGALVLATPYDGRWRLLLPGEARFPYPAFGWSVGFDLPAGTAPIGVVFTGQWARTAQIVLLAILWIGAVWIVRRPGRE